MRNLHRAGSCHHYARSPHCCTLLAMFIHFDADRASDSPFIERVWRCHSEGGGPFLSVASSHWEFVVSRVAGQTRVTLRGPETQPREVYCPPDGDWFAIRFKA